MWKSQSDRLAKGLTGATSLPRPLFAEVLVRYPDTYITVEGHTDSTGTTEYNQKLSERRADAVRDMLIRGGVPASRISIMGYGESDPVADNSTPEGRQSNRRVQLEIRPDEKLKARQG